MSVNKVILVGRLGADPESRTSANGTVIANLRMATSFRKRDEGGNWVDETEWHRVVAFGKVAENVTRFLKKGREVYIEGKIRSRKYTDKDGVERYITEILADNVVFLGGGREGAAGGDGGGAYTGGVGPPSGGGGGGAGGGGGGGDFGGGPPDDDIPF
jgi:single-strand DNA-binding protein